MLDLLYVNVKDAYCSSALPPLGRSDHNLVDHILACGLETIIDKEDNQEVVTRDRGDSTSLL